MIQWDIPYPCMNLWDYFDASGPNQIPEPPQR